MPTPQEMAAFQKTVWRYWRAHGRHDLPWRQPRLGGGFDPYAVLVSELMLQQTQVPRVLPKFAQFMRRFPTLAVLAEAPLAEVLRAWSGLGYNRRAKFLWQAARQIVREHGGRVPRTARELVRLPGIGPNTAGATLAYAFNQPAVYIETNVRSVFIHHFFAGDNAVSDARLKPLVAATRPAGQAREWYWALMDYGTWVKQQFGNVSRRSAAYAKQSAFQGSRRQIRGQVLRCLGAGPCAAPALAKQIPDERLAGVLADLEQEGFIQKDGLQYYLAA